MARPGPEVADVFRRYGDAYREQHGASLSHGAAARHDRDRTLPNRRAWRSCRAVRSMRPSAHLLQQLPKSPLSKVPILGPRPVARRPSRRTSRDPIFPRRFHRCRKRLPPSLYQNKETVYGILFRATAETLRTIAADPKHLGAEIGFFAVLHTWGQNLLLHPHLHCVVPGGGLSPDGTRWISCRPGFFLPVRVLSRLFRRLFLEYLQKAFDAGKLHFFSSLEPLRECRAFRRYLAPLRQAPWVVYAKPPFAGPRAGPRIRRTLYAPRRHFQQSPAATSRTARCASLGRTIAHDNRQKAMTVAADEFIRRFLLHVLPEGFHRIRYYGFLGNRHRAQKLARCRELLGMTVSEPAHGQAEQDYRDRCEELTGDSLTQCPVCRQGRMIIIKTIDGITTRPPVRDTS